MTALILCLTAVNLMRKLLYCVYCMPSHGMEFFLRKFTTTIFVSGVKMQGYLNKKSEKNKKWKYLHFVLLVNGTDTHLYFYDNPKVCKFMYFFLYQ
jgi:hypothetical protein